MSCDHVDQGRLLPYADALKLVLANVQPLSADTVPLRESLGAYLASAVTAPDPSPRFEQSAMDGYAVRLADVASADTDCAVALTLVGELPAGDDRNLTLEPGQTIKVFTGGRLPAGTSAVVMKEFVHRRENTASVAWRVHDGDHIRRVGEEFARGDVILPAQTRINPPVIGMLAFLGCAEVAVVRRPMVTVITMGNELADPGAVPRTGQIYDANGPALVAALQTLGLTRIQHHCVRDDPEALLTVMRQALAASDLVITAGGASVGDYDFVHGARQALGVRDLFDKVAIKPGKPNLFGLDPAGTPVYGLPGNPVSALVSFHQLVKPALVRMMGGEPDSQRRRLPARLESAVRKKKGRLNWLRGTLNHDEPLTATAVTGQGSHMLSGLALAEVLIELTAAGDGANAGDTVNTIALDWNR